MGLEELGKKLAQLGQDTVNSMQKTAEGMQVSNKISEEKKALEKVFAQIGEKIFNDAGDLIPEGMEDLFAAVKGAKESIAALEDQKLKLRNKPVCPNCGKEVGKDEKFCSACGTELPEMEAAPEKDVEALKAEAAAAASEVGDIVNEAASKARGLFGDLADKADAFVKGVASKINEKKEEAEDIDEDLEDFFEEEEDAVEEAAGEAQEAAEEAAEAAEDAVEEAGEAVEDAVEAVEDTVEEVKEAAEDAVDEIKDTFE